MLSITTAKTWRFQVRLRENIVNLNLDHPKGSFPNFDFFSIQLFYIKLTPFIAENERL